MSFLTQVFHLFLPSPSPSQTISVITVLCDLYKSQSSSLCLLWNYFLVSKYNIFSVSKHLKFMYCFSKWPQFTPKQDSW
jgi:hypothetical protein